MDKCPITGVPCFHSKCIHITEISNYEATESKDMCVFCGLPYISKEGGPEFDSTASQIFEMITSTIKNVNKQPQQPIKPPGCPTCGHTLEDVLIIGKIGCGNCYEFYKKELLPLIEKCQFGATKHIGKKPKRISKSLKELETELKTAIEKEEYEKAAVLMDEIKKLTG